MYVDFSKFVKNNQTIAVALSGGADSVALLHYMLSFSRLYPIKVIALNVEHGIRGEQSKNDTAFVSELCKKLNIELLKYEVDSPAYAKEHKLTIEQAARALRYDCFFDAIKTKKCHKIATAHHLSDNFETVLFNIFRGTGLKGLYGISDDRDNIIRPLLNVSRREIDEYIEKNAIPYVEDSSNKDNNFSRNYLRNEVIPKILEKY